jgi:hypothetical protein
MSREIEWAITRMRRLFELWDSKLDLDDKAYCLRRIRDKVCPECKSSERRITYDPHGNIMCDHDWHLETAPTPEPRPIQRKPVVHKITPKQLARFDEASNHPYECRCELCKEWWELVPPEDDGDSDDEAPAF